MISIGEHLSFEDLKLAIKSGQSIKLSDIGKSNILKSFNYLQHKIENSEDSFYGINTGFGSLCNTKIEKDDLSLLQDNLIKSHACGFGNVVDTEIVKLMLLLKAQSLSFGHSGVQLETVERLIFFYNQNIFPVVYEQGSLGASGDLAPLAHLCLPLIGLGEVIVNGERILASDMLKMFNLQPLKLKAKEGLALINGTQFMCAYGIYNILKFEQLFQLANKIACISIDAFDGRLEPFLPHSHIIRPHPGQQIVAAKILNTLSKSEIANQTKTNVQDPYSFRCIPQVHGASWDVLQQVKNVFLIEINSVTDNPNIFPDDDLILSAGNFHGQPLAMQLDFLAIAASELANISERRIYKLISGERNLPAFLIKNSGLNSGFMIPQYTAASIVSQNKQLCTPASVDSIVSSNGQEDHVSMGANAATKCKLVIDNLEKILSIELFNAAQAIEFRKPLKSSPEIEQFIIEFREKVNFIEEDCYMKEEMDKSLMFLRAKQ